LLNGECVCGGNGCVCDTSRDELRAPSTPPSVIRCGGLEYRVPLQIVPARTRWEPITLLSHYLRKIPRVLAEDVMRLQASPRYCVTHGQWIDNAGTAVRLFVVVNNTSAALMDIGQTTRITYTQKNIAVTQSGRTRFYRIGTETTFCQYVVHPVI
jgi:hypothetical protein